MTAALEAVDLSYSVGNTLILDKLSLKIEKNAFIGVIGPNGGGKTTFLKLLMGFIKPTSGKLLIFGKSPEEARPLIGYVPQSLKYDPNFPLTVFELVLSGLLRKSSLFGSYSEAEKAKANALLEKLHIAHLSSCPLGTLSGGQFQRALLARALISNPKILLLDEPTASIDAQAEEEIYELLATLKKDHFILMVTHDFKGAFPLFDQVLCLQKTGALFKPENVCGHFAIGLFHPPLKTLPQKVSKKSSSL